MYNQSKQDSSISDNIIFTTTSFVFTTIIKYFNFKIQINLYLHVTVQHTQIKKKKRKETKRMRKI